MKPGSLKTHSTNILLKRPFFIFMLILLACIVFTVCTFTIDDFYKNSNQNASQDTNTTPSAALSSTDTNPNETNQTTESTPETSTEESTNAITGDPASVLSGPATAPDLEATTISWITDMLCVGQVEISTDSTFELGTGSRFPSSVGATYKTNHEIILSNLANNTTYYYRIISRRPSGEETVSEIDSFTTPPIPLADDLPPAIIEGPTLSNIIQDSVTFDWVVNKAGTTEIVYSTTSDFFDPASPPNYGGTRAGDGSASEFFHSTTLSIFSPGVTYYCHTLTEDAFGLIGYSEELTFTTLQIDDRLGWLGGGGTACSPTPCFKTEGSGSTSCTTSNMHNNPSGVAVDSLGNVYTADYTYNRIQKYQSDGEWLGWVGMYDDDSSCDYNRGNHRNGFTYGGGGTNYPCSADGSQLGQFNVPVKIAVNDDDGFFYVVDRSNHRIVRYTLSGDLDEPSGCYLGHNQAGWHCNVGATAGSGDIEFDDPHGIAYDPSGFIYIADRDNNRIKKYQTDGTYVGCIGGGDEVFAPGCSTTPGAGDSYFYTPYDIDVGSDGALYIVDTGNHRIQKWDSAGNFLGWIGRGQTTGWANTDIHASGYGTEEGAFWSPWGITLDDSDTIYVADTGNHRIQKWNSAGEYQGWLGKGNTTFFLGMTNPPSSGSGLGEFNNPRGLAWDSLNSRLYVADSSNHRIQAFQF